MKHNLRHATQSPGGEPMFYRHVESLGSRGIDVPELCKLKGLKLQWGGPTNYWRKLSEAKPDDVKGKVKKKKKNYVKKLVGF